MTEKTIVVPSLVLSFKGQFSLRAVEDEIKKYMATTPYHLADTSYDIGVGETTRDQTVTFLFTHSPHTQEECRLRVTVSAEGVTQAINTTSIGVRQLYEGNLKVSMRAFTYSNADEHKQHKRFSFALRSLFNRLIYDTGGHEIGAEMKKYCYDIYDRLYALVNMGRPPEGMNA